MRRPASQLCIIMVFISLLAEVPTGFAQVSGGSIGIGAIPGTAYGGATDPSMVQIGDGFKVIPTVTVAERYDSNVYFVPKTRGLDRSDYVTTVAPQIRGLYAGSLVPRRTL